MKKSLLATGIILIAIVAVVMFWSKQKTNIFSRREETQQSASASPRENFEAQTNNEGGVTIEVSPRSINESAFAIVLNTHSVELSDDFAEAAVLKDENGKEYRPIGWEGTPPGGHHREGILKFGPLSPKPKKLELIISGIGGIPERKFLWTILP